VRRAARAYEAPGFTALVGAGTVLLVVGEGEDAFEVPGAPPEPVGELGEGDPFVTPAHEAPFERAQPRWSFAGSTAREARELQHPFDVVAAAMEAPTDLVGDHAGGREPTDATLEWAEILDVVHERDRTAW